MNQIFAARLMEKRGLEVVAVDNGRLAFEVMKEEDYHVVPMDVPMPLTNGYAVTQLYPEAFYFDARQPR